MKKAIRKAVVCGCIYGMVLVVFAWMIVPFLQPLPRLRLQAHGKQGVVGFSPDGSALVTTGAGPPRCWARFVWPIRVWDVQTGECVEIPLRDDDLGNVTTLLDLWINAIGFGNHDRKFAVLTSEGRHLRVYDDNSSSSA